MCTYIVSLNIRVPRTRPPTARRSVDSPAALRREDRVAELLRPIANPRIRNRALRSLDALERFRHRLALPHVSVTLPRLRLPSLSHLFDQSWELIVGVCCVLI